MAIPVGLWFDSTTNLDLLKTGIRAYWDNTDTEPLVEWKQVFKDKSVDQYVVRDVRFAGLGAMTETSDGQSAVLETPVLNTTKDYTQKKYTNGFRVTDMMKRYNKFDAVERWTRNLKKTMAEGKDIEVAKMWNNASATTYASGFDTLALASASHTCLDASATTFSNYGDSDLTTASYEAALKYFDTMKNDMAQISPKRATKLVVNPSFRVKAYQITGADKKPFEQSNTNYRLNAYFSWDVAPFVYHRLSSTTSWFLLGDMSDDAYGPTVFTGMEPKLFTEDTYDRSGDIACYSQQDFTYGFGDGRLVYVGDL